MKIVIDIPETAYEAFKEWHKNKVATVEQSLIAQGTPLPKGHGRLIDSDAELEGLRKMKVVDEKDKQSVRFAIIEYENAPTIIEADKAEEGEAE